LPLAPKAPPSSIIFTAASASAKSEVTILALAGGETVGLDDVGRLAGLQVGDGGRDLGEKLGGRGGNSVLEQQLPL
jgi:hypothetical protein